MPELPWQVILLVGLQIVHNLAFAVTTRGRTGTIVRRGYVTAAIWGVCFSILLIGALVRLTASGPPPNAIFIPAIMLVALGILLRIWGSLHLRHYFSPLIVVRADHKLITTGPYRRLRHPLHIGILVQVVGFAVITGAWWAYGLVALNVLNALARERVEERTLAAHFGADYETYRRRTLGLTDLYDFFAARVGK